MPGLCIPWQLRGGLSSRCRWAGCYSLTAVTGLLRGAHYDVFTRRAHGLRRKSKLRNDGEVLATGIGLLPRLAASLAMRTTNPDMMMTDSQSYMLSSPNPVSGMTSHEGQANENWMGLLAFLTMSGAVRVTRW